MKNEIQLRKCPKCGKLFSERGAVSRVDNVTIICPDCGTREALESIGVDEKEQENKMLEREKKQLVQEYDTLSMRVAVKQMDYEEADERVKEANERADRIEAYIKTQSDTLVDLEEKATKLERKAEIAEQVYEMACGSGGNEALREKLIDIMYENEQLKAENSKLRETLNKAYDFMKQFVVDGRNLLDRFLESIGQVVEKVRDGFRR